MINQQNQAQVMPPGQAQPNGQAQPMPYPAAPPMQQQGPFDPYQNSPPGQVAPATPGAPLPYPPGQGSGDVNTPGMPGTGKFNTGPVGEDNVYGGQQIAGAQPGAADYGSVQNYADAAYENQARYMDPQHAQQNRRMDQELINKGIDPGSPQGQEMAKMLAMQQGDQQNAAQFGAMQFGQGIQNQMAQQEMANQQLAGNMQQAQWANNLGASGQNLQKYLGDQNYNLGKAGIDMQGQIAQNAANNQRYGMDLGYNQAMSGQDLQRYGMDQQNQLGMGQLDLGRQGQSFNEMMGLDATGFRNQQAGQQQQNWQDQFLYSMMMGQGAPQQYQNNAMGGLGQADQGMLGQAAGPVGTFFSDRRLKRNINPVGEISGVNLYSYNYIWDDVDRIGPMAQEVPWAAFETESGFLAVDMRRVL